MGGVVSVRIRMKESNVKDNASSCHACGWAKTGLSKPASLFQLLPFHPTLWDTVSLDFIIDLCAVKKVTRPFWCSSHHS